MTNATHTTENMMIHHKVKDYATWRSGYDGHEKSRLSAGITNGQALPMGECSAAPKIRMMWWSYRMWLTWQSPAPGLAQMK